MDWSIVSLTSDAAEAQLFKSPERSTQREHRKRLFNEVGQRISLALHLLSFLKKKKKISTQARHVTTAGAISSNVEQMR
jgi:hypothetical protein